MKIKNYLIFSILLGIFIQQDVFAIEQLQGVGIEQSAKKARSLALQDLSSSLFVEVNSQITICQQVSKDDVEDCGSKNFISTKSNLPLLGITYSQTRLKSKETQVVAVLESDRSLKLYRSELTRLQQLIKSQSRRLKESLSQQVKLTLLNQLYSDIEQFEKLRLVASLLGDSKFSAAPMSNVEVSALVSELQQRADSMDYVGRILAEKLAKQKVYIFPPTLRNAKEITPFARSVRDQLKKNSSLSVNELIYADYLLRGQYEILEDGDIQLTYKLLDLDHNNLSSYTLRVVKAAYSGFRASALAPDFDQLLHQNIAISNQFKSEIVTDNGSQDLFFIRGEDVRLLVRLNQPGYFFVVGHVVQKDREFSYLIELNDGVGSGKFIKYVPPDHANRYVELGQFEVEPPFGVEHLQMIASNINLDTNIPAHFYDDKTGYYVITGSRQNTKSAVLKTRGLKSKVSKLNDQQLFHESVLTFTTTP